MNYKEHYNELTNEAEVPFAAADTIKKAPTINLPAADIKTAKPVNTGKYIPKIQIRNTQINITI